MAIENMLAMFGENMNGDMAGISCNIFAWASHAGHEIAPWRNLWGDFLSGLIDPKHAMAAPPLRHCASGLRRQILGRDALICDQHLAGDERR